jgi:hypothetical protein
LIHKSGLGDGGKQCEHYLSEEEEQLHEDNPFCCTGTRTHAQGRTNTNTQYIRIYVCIYIYIPWKAADSHPHRDLSAHPSHNDVFYTQAAGTTYAVRAVACGRPYRLWNGGV